MAIETACQTPGAHYSTYISENRVLTSVYFSSPLKLTGEEAEILEANIHNALELVLAPYFKDK